MIPRFTSHGLIALALLAMAGCDMPGGDGSASAQRAALGRDAPQGAPDGTCWDKTVTPAVVETVTETVLVQPAQISSTGTVQSPPVYRDQTRQRIVTPRQEIWYQMPCASDLTPEFIASVQRALTARGYYAAPVTQVLDDMTRSALARYQQAEGLRPPRAGALDVKTAQRLGLWAVALVAED